MSQHDPLPAEDTGCGILSLIALIVLVFGLAFAAGLVLGVIG